MSDRQGQAIAADSQEGEGSLERRGRRRHRNRQARPEASINMEELRELIALIKENGLAEFELEKSDFRVRLRRDSYPGTEAGTEPLPAASPESEAGSRNTPAQTRPLVLTAPAHPGARAETAASEDQDLHIITSPIVGTFFRSPSPTAEAFVKIGSHVEPDTVVCIIEAMKLMNEIQAETIGELTKIYVENGQPVEYGQPLFGIKK
jgi:acetyl-CoA carboxylase biotin carboxyl carrier protein